MLFICIVFSVLFIYLSCIFMHFCILPVFFWFLPINIRQMKISSITASTLSFFLSAKPVLDCIMLMLKTKDSKTNK